MIKQGRFNSYLELLFLTLVNRTQEPVQPPSVTYDVEQKIMPQLAEAAQDTASESLCTTTSDLTNVTPWLTSQQWQSSMYRLFHFQRDVPVAMEIRCPKLFTTFFDLKGKMKNQSIEKPEAVANQVVSWYALQTCVMFSYSPGIELMYGNHTAAVEEQEAACLYLTTWFSGTAHNFVSLPMGGVEDIYWYTRSIVNGVTDSFLNEFMGSGGREKSTIRAKLLTRNRLAISLLRQMATTATKWTTFYSPHRPFVLVWRWASDKRLPRSFWQTGCCSRQGATSALAPRAAECCGLFEDLVATSEWDSLPLDGIDDETRRGAPPYLVQPIAWNVPFFAPDLQLPVKYGALGSVLAALVAANYFEAGEGRQYEARVETLTACHNGTEMAAAVRTSMASFDSIVRSLALRNASLEALWNAYSAVWEEDREREASAEDVARKRRSDDRLFFMSWCLTVCGEPGARELCNEPLTSGGIFARRNFTTAFGCRAGAPMTVPSKCTAQ
ncbi:uncharacterized protein LOC144097938 [Amblyomma americanum]